MDLDPDYRTGVSILLAAIVIGGLLALTIGVAGASSAESDSSIENVIDLDGETNTAILQQDDTGWEETVDGSITADNPFDNWYFQVSEGATISAELSRMDGTGTFVALLVDPEALTIIAETEVNPGESGQLSATAPYTGEYAIYIFGTTPDAMGDYSLTVGVSEAPDVPDPGPDPIPDPVPGPDEFEEIEPNDEFDLADEIDRDTFITGVLTQGDVDFFEFDADADEDLTIEYARGSSTGVQAVIIYDPDEQFMDLAFVGTDTPIEIDITTEQNGSHYVQVVDVEQGVGPYALQVFAEDSDDFDNSDPFDEFVLEPGDSVDGEITEYYLWDVYAFEGEAGDPVAFELSRTGGDGTLWLLILDEAGNLITYGSADPDSTETIQATLLTSGMYFVEIGGAQPGDSGQYTLTMLDAEEIPEPPNGLPFSLNDGPTDDDLQIGITDGDGSNDITNETDGDETNP